jgi:Prolipoprotein diacylglyceryl transferase
VTPRDVQWPRRVGPDLHYAGRTVPIFRLTALTGAAVAVSLAVWECSRLGGSPLVELGLCLGAVLTFLTLAFVTKAVAGREVLVYYHHEIAVLAVTATACLGLGLASPGRYLDATALGLGACLAIGRLGCLAAGCCHGRPGTRGVVYGERYATELPAWLLGVRLVPVQAIESVLVLLLVAVGLLAVADPHAPGAAFVWYVEAYAVLRFLLEELRGDSARRFARGLSEAQWTSLAVGLVMAVLGLAGVTRGGVAGLAVLALTWPAAAAVSFRARRGAGDVLHPRHVRELATLARGHGRTPSPAATSLGVLVSHGEVERVEHWSMSRRRRALSEREATILAGQLVAIRRPDGPPPQVVEGVGGVFHVLVPRS